VPRWCGFPDLCQDILCRLDFHVHHRLHGLLHRLDRGCETFLRCVDGNQKIKQDVMDDNEDDAYVVVSWCDEPTTTIQNSNNTPNIHQTTEGRTTVRRQDCNTIIIGMNSINRGHY
jgi:hypothetical protein